MCKTSCSCSKMYQKDGVFLPSESSASTEAMPLKNARLSLRPRPSWSWTPHTLGIDLRRTVENSKGAEFRGHSAVMRAFLCKTSRRAAPLRFRESLVHRTLVCERGWPIRYLGGEPVNSYSSSSSSLISVINRKCVRSHRAKSHRRAGHIRMWCAGWRGRPSAGRFRACRHF